MKNNYLYALLFFSITLFGQTAKKEYLIDENDKPVTGTDFKNKIKDPHKYHYTITETDSTLTGRLVPTEEYGIFSEKARLEILKELEELSGRKINTDAVLVINFYFKEPVRNQRPCIDNYTTDGAYKRFFKRHDEYAQFFITEKGFDYGKKVVFEDKNEVIRNTVFKYIFHCGNYIIIKPNGHYLRRVGEYRQDEIPDKVKAEW